MPVGGLPNVVLVQRAVGSRGGSDATVSRGTRLTGTERAPSGAANGHGQSSRPAGASNVTGASTSGISASFLVAALRYTEAIRLTTEQVRAEHEDPLVEALLTEVDSLGDFSW